MTCCCCVVVLRLHLHDTTGCQTAGCQAGLRTHFDNRVERTATVRSTGCKTGCTTVLTTGCIHDTAGCQSGCQTGLTTGCIV